MKYLGALLLAFTLAGSTEGCAGSRFAAPAQLSPVGDVAFYGVRVLQGISALQDVAIEGERAGVISTVDARKIMQATKVAGEAGQKLARALAAGASEDTAKRQAIAVIRQVLTDLPGELSPETSKLIAPYVATVVVLLTVFGSN